MLRTRERRGPNPAFGSGERRGPNPALGFLALFVASAAQAAPDAALVQRLERALDVTARAAGRAGLVPGSAEAWSKAEEALGKTAGPTAALEALGPDRGGLFRDREALVRGDALVQLGELKAARKAYETALASAVVPSVAASAVRSLAEIHTEQGRYDVALAHLDALIGRYRRPPADLLFSKARLLESADRLQPAMQLATEVAREHASSRWAEPARALMTRLQKRGAKPEASPEALGLARVEGLMGSGKLSKALEALRALKSSDLEAKYLEAHILERLGEADDAVARYEALGKQRKSVGVAAKALERLAKRALRADDNPAALTYFDKVARLIPSSGRGRRAEYLAGWIPYDAGDYAEARRRMLAYAKKHPRARDRDEALWYAGWASYLEGAFPAAEGAFEKLTREHARSSLTPQAYYWIGRIAQRSERAGAAKDAYDAVLAREPLRYYALWASRRLGELGVKLDAPTPPEDASDEATVASVLAGLGPKRPITVDRAIHLHRVGRLAEAVEELESSGAALRESDRAVRADVAALLHRLGAHHLAFRNALGITGDGSKLADGDPLEWRAWRHAYPRAFAAEVSSAHEAHAVQPEMVWAVMRTESHYRPWVRSRVGARGLMQLMPATARHIGRVAEGARPHAARFKEAESNIWLGTWYLSELMTRYDGQLVPAVGAYNGGPHNMDRWLADFDGMPLDEFVERIPYRETRRYVRRVVETWAIYRQLYEGERPDLPDVIRSVIDDESEASF